ncbi:MFS transporter [Frankia sp. CNm7]|uniref:MFS transporter n=2 Tax=Frankia nepalensis TaxID=1836974 RepID=A0A937UNC8_9ACTN|nr:MFS transporter [Frankia nepalensis]MBL7509313.1 MFS transporter [Frankia nepalensis]MBL7516899.1 MFS transporter [Frankia nepalensis]MBL7627958.1 MFS transporter [Frankia nepalensis]
MISMVLLGLLVGSWAPRIPGVKQELGVSDGELGVALLGAPLGAVATMWLTGMLLDRFGSRAVVRVMLVLTCSVGVLVAFAGDVAELFAVLALWGAAGSALDVGLNAQIATVERRYGRPIMTTAHAAWAAGALAGAGVGSAGAGLDVPLAAQFGVVGAFCLVAMFPATGAMLPPEPAARGVAPQRGRATAEPAAPRRPGRVGLPEARRRVRRFRPRRGRMPRALVALCAMAFATMLCEGVAADWSALYLEDVTGAAAGVSGVGYAVFNGCMLLTRIVGDRATLRFGPDRLVRALAGAAACLFALALATGATAAGTLTGVVGFAALGAGTACVFPVGVSAAVRVGTRTGASVAAFATLGYVGWLSGPALIGGLSELVGLRGAMIVVIGLLAVIVLLAPALAAGDDQRAAPVPAELPVVEPLGAELHGAKPPGVKPSGVEPSGVGSAVDAPRAGEG